jgi:hypothetical protein
LWHIYKYRRLSLELRSAFFGWNSHGINSYTGNLYPLCPLPFCVINSSA